MTQPDPRERHRERTHQERAGDRCPRCGRSYADADRVDVHHRDGNPRNGSPENLRKRCRVCHLAGEHDRNVTRSKEPNPPRTAPRGVRAGPR